MCFFHWFFRNCLEKSRNKVKTGRGKPAADTRVSPTAGACSPRTAALPLGSHLAGDLLHPHPDTKLLVPCSAPHHVPVCCVSGFCSSSSCFQLLLRVRANISNIPRAPPELLLLTWHTGPSSLLPSLAPWPHCPWKGTLCVAFYHPPRIIWGQKDK